MVPLMTNDEGLRSNRKDLLQNTVILSVAKDLWEGDIVRLLHTMEQVAEPGWEIVMTKWAALSWTVEAVRSHKEALEKELPTWFLRQAAGLDEYLETGMERQICASLGIKAVYEMSEGGVFSGLWDMAEFSDCGLSVRLSDIPIRQETVEIAEILDENPYLLPSRGSLLAAAADGSGLCDRLHENGVEAAVIGRLMSSKDRVIIGREGIRYLEPSTRMRS